MTTHGLSARHIRLSLAARLRAWWYRPSRAELIADRNAAQARAAELTALIEQHHTLVEAS